jgi:hypothetical protein
MVVIVLLLPLFRRLLAEVAYLLDHDHYFLASLLRPIPLIMVVEVVVW